MERTSTTAGSAIPTLKVSCYRSYSTISSSWKGPFRFFDLPEEIRAMIYHEVFTPSVSDVNPTKQNTTLRLTYTSHHDPAVQILNRERGQINILRPTYFASFAQASRRTYNEAIPIIARHTSLHLSGQDYDYFHVNIHPLSFVGGLLQEVARYTSHLVVEASILGRSTSLQDQLVAQDIFPRLRSITVHSCGPAELTYSGLPFALGPRDAEKLLCTKSWPNTTLQNSAGSILCPWGCNYMLDGPSGRIQLLHLLEDLRIRFSEPQKDSSPSELQVKQFELVLKLPIRGTIMSVKKTSNVQFDVSEITLDFNTNRIIDVSFHKVETIPAHHRAISITMAFLDKPITGPVRLRPRVARVTEAISFMPRA